MTRRELLEAALLTVIVWVLMLGGTALVITLNHALHN